MVRRLVSARYWQIPRDFEVAVDLAMTRADDIDWPYAERIAKDDGVTDLLVQLRERIRPRGRGLPNARPAPDDAKRSPPAGRADL